MATVIRYDGLLFEFDADAMEWRARGDDDAAKTYAGMFNDLLDPDGPSGSEPDPAMWAVESVREVVKGVVVVERDEPARDRFIVY